MGLLVTGFIIFLVVLVVRDSSERKKIFSRLDNLEQQIKELRGGKVSTSTPPPVPSTPAWQPPIQDKTITPSPASLPVGQSIISTALKNEKPSYPPPVRPPVTPREVGPSPLEPVIKAIKNFLTGGNVIVRVGMIVLFTGVTFLIKLATDAGWFPLELRLATAGAVGLGLTGIGWRLRHKKEGFSLALQGGGIGIFYLSTFAAFRLYHLIPSGAAFAILVATVLFSSLLAIRQNAPSLMIMALSGGFLAPLLTSDGSGSHVALFSYYAVLNIGIFVVAWFKAWRLLNVLGFIFTFGIGSFWGAQFYTPEHFATTEPFLIIFFLFYFIIPILFALKVKPELKGFVDGPLVFGTPVVSLGLQYAMVKNLEYGMAWTTLAMALLYLTTAWILILKKRETFKMMAECFLAIGTAAGTLCIPMAFNVRWTAASWALEGAGLVWVGIRQKRWLARLAGVGLVFTGGFMMREWLQTTLMMQELTFPVFNGLFLGGMIKSLSALLAGYFFVRWKENVKGDESKFFSFILMLWGLAWWYTAGLFEVRAQLGVDDPYWAYVVFLGSSMAFFEWVGAKLGWKALREAGSIAAMIASLFVLQEDWLFTWFAVGGMALLTVSLRSEPRTVSRFVAVIFLLLSNFVFLREVSYHPPRAVWNLSFAFTIVRMLALFVAGHQVWKRRAALDPVMGTIGRAFILSALIQFLGGIFLEVRTFASHANQIYYQLSLTGLTVMALEILRRRLSWGDLKLATLSLMPLTVILFAMAVTSQDHPLTGMGGMSWVLVLAVHFWALKRMDGDQATYPAHFHAIPVWLITYLVFWEAQYRAHALIGVHSAWSEALWLFVPAMTVLAIVASVNEKEWPWENYRKVYLTTGAVPVAAYLSVQGFIIHFWATGNPSPLPYLPLLNPLDLSVASAIVALWGLSKQLRLHTTWNKHELNVFSGWLLGMMIFLWMNAVIARTFHYYWNVDLSTRSLMDSMPFQASLSIFWTLFASSLMIVATKQMRRSLWVAGAALLGLVVLKLFLIDLSKQQTVFRIISFMGVGFLFLLIGYFSPMPPKNQASEETL